MMRSDIFVAYALTQMACNAFGQPPGINKNKSSAVLADQLRQAIVNFIPNFAGHHSLQGRLREFNGNIKFSHVTTVHDGAIGRAVGFEVVCPYQEARHFIYGALRRRQANANETRVRAVGGGV